MLYLSTRNKADSFTAYRVLHSEAAPDGGMFLPMQLPVQDDAALAAFESCSFGETAASILNLFFGTQLSGWDVDFAIGRQALDLVSAGYKVSLAESWHNPAGTHAYLVQRLYNLVIGEKYNTRLPNSWFRTVVNIAVLFGVYGKYCRQEIYEFDIAVQTGDLLTLLAIRYAQKMGLPIRKIILGSLEGDGLWEFLSYGDYQTNHKEVLAGFEALLWLEFGYSEAETYAQTIANKRAYRLKEWKLDHFRKDLFLTVVGDHRVKNVIDSMLRTNNYQMEQSTARAFAALQDYRAKTGENKNTLLFSRNAPAK